MAKSKKTTQQKNVKSIKRPIMWIAIIAGIAAIGTMAMIYCTKPNSKVIQLAAADKTAGTPLMATIDSRASAREFANTDLAPQTLADVLWAAWDTNQNGTRTIPTAKNEQNLKVYAVMREGAYLYNGVDNKLELVTTKHLRADYIAINQEFVKDAPLTLVYVGSDPKWSPMHAGSSYQNVGLYAASNGLAARVRGWLVDEGLKKELNLLENEHVSVSITIGNAK